MYHHYLFSRLSDEYIARRGALLSNCNQRNVVKDIVDFDIN